VAEIVGDLHFEPKLEHRPDHRLVDTDVYAAEADTARAALPHEPSKTDIAARLIDVDGQIVAQDKIELLAALHVALSDALEIPDERRPKLTSK
jgi:hypothetical protein